MRYHHIVWDFDGTLFDSYPALAHAFQQALAEFGIHELLTEILRHMKQSMGQAHQFYRETYALGDEFFARYEALRIPAEEDGTRPFEGMPALCGKIVASGGKNYVFTHRGPTTAHFMEKYKLMPLFSELITSQQPFPRKPSPEGLLYLAQTHQFSSNDAMMVGDRALDILAGERAGMATCAFGEAVLESVNATHVARHVADIHAILFG